MEPGCPPVFDTFAPVQPRTFLELKSHLLDLNLPESTKEVWSREL